jgi:ATP-dependent Clp protease ATP-binding subunit ClpA
MITPEIITLLMFDFCEAEDLPTGQRLIGPEHILLALLDQEEGVATRVLEELGVSRFEMRTQVRWSREHIVLNGSLWLLCFRRHLWLPALTILR